MLADRAHPQQNALAELTKTPPTESAHEAEARKKKLRRMVPRAGIEHDDLPPTEAIALPLSYRGT
jgi:hypothetical protein